MDRQKTLGCYVPPNLSQRIGIIAAVRLPKSMTSNDGNVRACVIKSLLNHLSDFAGQSDWSWPSRETLADRIGVSIRQVTRAIQAAVNAGLIVVDPRKSQYGVVLNHYQIQWGRLAELGEQYQHPELRSPPPQSIDHPPTDVPCGQTDVPCGQTDVPQRHTNPHTPPNQPNIKPPSGRVLKSGEGRSRLTVSDLRSVAALESLITRMIARGSVTDADAETLAVLAWAEHCAARSGMDADHRCATFVAGLTGQLPGRSWRQRPTADEEDIARRRLAEHRGHLSPDTTPRRARSPTSDEAIRDMDQKRQAALAMLAAIEH